MGKLYLLAIVSMLTVGVVAYTPVVSAQATETTECETSTVENTGPGSVNVIECEDSSTIKVTCNNDTSIVLNNDQVSESGDVTIEGNTIGGKGTSGDATNSSASNIDIAAVCAALAKEETPAPTPTPSPSPTPKPAAAKPAPVVAALPNTGNETMVEKALIAAGASSLLGLSILGSTKLYRRFNA